MRASADSSTTVPDSGSGVIVCVEACGAVVVGIALTDDAGCSGGIIGVLIAFSEWFLMLLSAISTES